MIEELETIRLLHELGFSSKLKGFTYLKDMINYILLNKLDTFMMNELYKRLSKKYNSTINSVTKCISEAISKSWTKANLDLIALVFGYSIGYDNNCPTNSLFVCSVIDYLKGFIM